MYTADLTGLAPEPGCTIKVPAVELCVQAVKANVTPTPPSEGPANPAGNFACYKVKCPKAALAPVMVNDQFGARMVAPSAPKLLCAPEGVAGTTTSTIALQFNHDDDGHGLYDYFDHRRYDFKHDHIHDKQ